MCYYCNLELNETGIGLDRLDNKNGYNIDNVVPCCGPCNYTRGNRFTVKEMLNELGPAIRRIKQDRAT